MKYILKLLIIFTLITLIKPSKLNAQEGMLWGKDWSVSGEVGLDYFFGDGSDSHNRIYNNSPLSSFYWENKGFMASITLAKQLDRYWGLRMHFLYGSLSGSNDNIKITFTGKVFASDMDVTFNFIDLIFKRPEKAKYKYYAFAGFGITGFRSISRVMGTGNYINEVGYQDTGRSVSNLNTQGLLTMGLGVKYNLNKKMFLHFRNLS